MDNNTAYAYKLDEDYTSIYVNLNGYEQMIFYWSLATDCEKRKPKWRLTKETIQEGASIVSYDRFGCVIMVDNRRAEFTWYEYDRPDNRPAHKARLDNFADWEFDLEFKNNSTTSTGNHYQGFYSGHYSSPQEYTED